MSGTSALGTLLVQRMDAVLGTQIASRGSMIAGLRTDAVTQPGALARVGISENPGNEKPSPAPEGAPGIAPSAQGRRARQATSQAALALARNTREIRQDATPSAPTSLGRAARTILSVLALFPDDPPALSADAPLWRPAGGSHSGEPGAAALRHAGTAVSAAGVTARPTATQFTDALQRAIGSSGIFYESDIAKLACGQKNLQQLREQPQGKMVSAESASADPIQSPGRAGGAHSDASGMHPSTAAIVRHQLDALAYQAISWRGQAWPETEMDWKLNRDDNETPHSASPTWKTRLTLTLPRLGAIEAGITLAGNQVVMRIQAPTSSDEIGESAENLRARFGAAGLTLSNLLVER